MGFGQLGSFGQFGAIGRSGGSRPSWVLSAATLDYDFVNNRYFGGSLSDLSITRASTGYADTASGLLTSFSTGTLRRTDRGLLIELARTNLCVRSQEFDNVSWVKSDTTVTPNDAVAPDGTLTAAKIVFAGNGGIDQIYQNTTFGSSATKSVYIKGTPGETITLSNALSSNVLVTLTGGWDRAVLTATDSDFISIRISGAETARTIWLWGAQVEAGSEASSYIPTSGGSATRAADMITAGGNLLSLIQNTAGTCIAEFQTPPTINSITTRIYDVNSSQMLFYTSVGGVLITRDAGVNQPNASATLTGISKIGGSWDASNVAVVGNNGTVSSSSTSTPGTLGTTYIGNRSAGDRALRSYLRRLTLWSTKLPDATMKALTA
jgi:hypothetical protein